FAGAGAGSGESWDRVFQMKVHSSYGEIARHLLTRKLAAGVIPWEIFVTDVFALPGQRNQWTVSLLMDACPTELVLRPSVHRLFYPAQPEGRVKLPARLIVGVQNQNSLTKAQFQEWLSHWKGSAEVEVVYKMLPMNLRIHALEAETVDATIAPAPWGMYAESIGIGVCDPRFTPGRFAQQVALVCRKDFFESRPGVAGQLPRMMAAAREALQQRSGMAEAVGKMASIGKLELGLGLFEKAAALHGFDALPPAIAPDVQQLALAFARLAEQAILPVQVAAGEQTARLLLAADF
ncbi:MAG: ABC transporter substrate-binding protein, partial [Luteolibacter sp.]